MTTPVYDYDVDETLIYVSPSSTLTVLAFVGREADHVRAEVRWSEDRFHEPGAVESLPQGRCAPVDQDQLDFVRSRT